jgi:radial spoke head protein 3
VAPDFYVDKSQAAVFVPDPDGVDKSTELRDMFDFNLEVEPLLQVLIGRTLEHARIEVVEAYEQQELEKHKVAYKRLRENELLRTQQVEMAQKRKNDEIEATG